MQIKSKNHRGNILIIFLVFLTPLILVLLSSIRLNHAGNEKIRQQIYTDSLNLEIVSTQVQALNAIAVYNQGLKIALERGYMFATALLTLRLCVVFTRLASSCTIAWFKLEKKAAPFYRKLQKLVDHMAKQQDDILAWSQKAPTAILAHHQIIHANSHFLIRHPIDFSLAIQRQGSCKKGREKECFGKGQDISKCKVQTFHHHARLVSQSQIHLKKSDFVDVIYQEEVSSSQKKKRFPPPLSLSHIPKSVLSSGRIYSFKKAHLNICYSFHSVLQKINNNFPLRFNVPPPYVLSPQFFTSHNRIRLAIAQKLNPLLQEEKLSSTNAPYTQWTFSEAHIHGEHILSNTFDAALHNVTDLEALNETISKKELWLRSLGFKTPKRGNR